MIDRRQTKNEIRDQLVALAADHGTVLSNSRADKLANKFKKGLFDPELAALLSYRDPTGEQAVARVLATA